MKAITVREAQGQLGQLVAEACRGETIVLTDGDNEVTLSPRSILDLEEDSPELEAELLKAANGPFTTYSSEEMRAACEKVIGEKTSQLGDMRGIIEVMSRRYKSGEHDVAARHNEHQP